MPNERYIVMTVQCSNCKTKQKVHVDSRTELPKMEDQTIRCLQCDSHFKVTIPDKILRGPYPA
jgi:hypothetical protein